jgi:hypothetical protein
VTTIRTLATHAVVERTHPRPPPNEADHVAMAAGRAIDGTLSQLGYQVRSGRKPTATSIRRLSEELLGDALAEEAVAVTDEERRALLGQIDATIRAYRVSVLFGLARPKSRVVLIGGRVGIYAQPDYWDGRARFYEMKSYLAIPPPPDVALQLRLFQLAFPQFGATLVCLDRHRSPVETRSYDVPPPSEEETRTALRLAYDLGVEFGEEKVIEYMEGPFVRYDVPPE